MSAINNCTFVGNVVRDSELKSSQGGTSFLNNAIAVNSGYGDNKKTDFFNFTVFGKRAESFAKYVQKGNRIAIQCEAHQRSYTDRSGNKVNTVDFSVNDWEFAQSKSESNSSPSPAQTSAPTAAPSNDDFMNIADGIDEEIELPFS